jgi:hypothetical protein
MSAFGWQDAVVVLAVLAAAGWLTRRQILKRRQRGCGCEDCPGRKSLLEAAKRRRLTPRG